ncbi:crossover junction endodeoxyribonuclease RuvC [Aerococcaceae bacterium DSM 111022]|nr:crossover junction endodeoxyribonuclease RuvC [Aerococcaceae bacterium DSM 111022]
MDSPLKIIAFDQSTTATGFCIMEMGTANIIESGVILPKKNDETIDRVTYTIKRCLNLVRTNEVAFVFIEGVQVQRNPAVYEVLAKLAGTLEVMLYESGYFVNVVKATEWRRRVGIKSRKRAEVKKEAIEMVKEIYDLEVSEDEAEAVLFARAFAKEN